MQKLKHFLDKNTILASQSPRRIEILSALHIEFESIPSGTAEQSIEKTPSGFVLDIAFQKAFSVAQMYPEKVVIGADTVVVHRGQIFGKPKTEEQAKEMLAKLSGSTHQVISAAAVLYRRKPFCNFFVTTHVTFSEISPEAIGDYINTRLVFDRAGAYGIQDDFGKIHVTQIQGDYLNVVGFPLQRFCQEMMSKI